MALRDAAAAHRALDLAWARLAVHIRAEHKVLFPALAEVPELSEGLALLRKDHDAFMTALAGAVQGLAAPAPDVAFAAAALAQMTPRLAAHNALEEADLYPKADVLPMRARLLQEVQRELAALPPRFRA